MQRRSRVPIFILVAACALAGGAAALMLADVPSPMQPIRQPIDAQTLLGTQP